MRLRALLVLSVLLSSTVAVAGLKEGYAALSKKDYVTAANEYRPLAERGDAEAQYRIGRMYEFGNGYPQDKAQGIAWIRKAAAQGHVDAEQELGVVYATGDGVTQDDVQAVAWFRKAAEQGDATAQYNLGLLYAKGQGVTKDYAQSVDWWRKSAAQGNADAQFKLAVVYHTGQGAAKDEVVALANATLAARNGDKENIDYRNEIAKPLTPEQRRNATSLANAWKVGQPTPGSAATSGSASVAAAAAPAAPMKTRCSATGTMGGERFTATHCVASLYGDQHSVAIWFNEDAITPEEADELPDVVVRRWRQGRQAAHDGHHHVLSGRRQARQPLRSRPIHRPQHQPCPLADGGHPARGPGAQGLQGREDDWRSEARRSRSPARSQAASTRRRLRSSSN